MVVRIGKGEQDTGEEAFFGLTGDPDVQFIAEFLAQIETDTRGFDTGSAVFSCKTFVKDACLVFFRNAQAVVFYNKSQVLMTSSNKNADVGFLPLAVLDTVGKDLIEQENHPFFVGGNDRGGIFRQF